MHTSDKALSDEARTQPGTGRRPRVLVVGAGFAGLSVIRGLRHAPVDITVINRTNHHLFQPLAYQVATGLLSPGEIAPTLRTVLCRQTNATVLLAEATDVDLSARTITVLEPGGKTSSRGYDYLVIATGAQTNYLGHEDWAPNLYPIKSLAEATRLNQQLLHAYARAAECADPVGQVQWRTFVVVGGGPTGVEVAGQLASLAREVDAELHRDDPARSRIVLIDASEEVLGAFPPKLRAHAHRKLASMGVEFFLDARAENVDADGIDVTHHDGSTERIAARTVIWAAGVHAGPLAATLSQADGVDLDHHGRVRVGLDGDLPGHREVFVIGDIANLNDLPGLSEPALQEGRHVAKVLRHLATGRPAPQPFRYLDLGTMATIAPKDAIADTFGLQLEGKLGKLAWAGVHIAFLVGWGNRASVLTRWAFLLSNRTRAERSIMRVVSAGGADTPCPTSDPPTNGPAK